MYKSLTPNIMVSNVNQTVKWYQDHFGFQLENQTGSLGEELEWAVVKADDVCIFFQKQESLVKEMPIFKDKEIGASLTFYISVDNLENLYNLVKNNVEIVRDVRQTFYGAKEFAVRDLNGYILVFSEMKE